MNAAFSVPIIHDMPHIQVNTGFLPNPPKQHFGDKKSKLTGGEGSPQHQLGGDNRTVPLPHSSFRIPGWHTHSQRMKWCFWDVVLNRMQGRRTGRTSHTNTTSAAHILWEACCDVGVTKRQTGRDKINCLSWLWELFWSFIKELGQLGASICSGDRTKRIFHLSRNIPTQEQVRKIRQTDSSCYSCYCTSWDITVHFMKNVFRSVNWNFKNPQNIFSTCHLRHLPS